MPAAGHFLGQRRAAHFLDDRIPLTISAAGARLLAGRPVGVRKQLEAGAITGRATRTACSRATNPWIFRVERFSSA